MLFALQNKAHGHLGFVLFAGDGGVSGDCLIRPLPHSPDLWESDEFRFLEHYREAGEFSYRFEDDRKKLTIEKAELRLVFERTESDGRYLETHSGTPIFGVLEEKE